MILLDTHAWIWWASSPDNLSKRALKAAEDAIQGEGGLAVSSISVWEVMLLVQKKRLRLAIDVQEWIKKNEQMPFLRFLPLTNSIAVQSVLLPPPLHGDPADRIIAATACIHNMALITKDSRLQTCPEVRTIW